MKYTKGPWKVSSNVDSSLNNGHYVHTEKDGLQQYSYVAKGLSLENAHLVSAAPELLEALIRLVEIYHDHQEDSEAAALDQAIDAIKKATGGL